MKNKVNTRKERDKAFIGAAIGAVAGIAGGIIGGAKKKRAEEEALRQEQTEQNKADTLQAAQAMTSSYANQDYVDDYNKKITLRMGGKVKKDKEEHENYIGYKNIVNDVVAGKYGNGKERTDRFTREGLDGNAIQRSVNKAMKSKNKSYDLDMDFKDRFKNNNPRKKKALGSVGSNIGDAAGGVGGLVSSLFQSSSAPKTVTRSAGTLTSAPKSGLTARDYGVSQTAVPPMQTTNPIIQTNTTSNTPVYEDRLQTLRAGGKRKIRR